MNTNSVRLNLRGEDLIKKVKIAAILANKTTTQLCGDIIIDYFKKMEQGPERGPEMSTASGKKKKK